MSKCDENCKECIICKGLKTCCKCDWNNGYHACVTWPRKGKNEKTKTKSVEINPASSVRMDSEKREA
jgi:hypothetical protein